MTAERVDARSPKWIRWVAFTSLVAVSVGIVANPGDEYLWITLNNLASFAAAAWATAAGIGAARRCRGREQVAWILMATGSGLWTLGQIGWAWYQVVLRSEPPLAGALDVLFVGAPVLWTAAIATFVIAPAGLWSRALEATMVVGAAFIPAWLLILQPVADQSTESTFVVTVNLLYPVMDMLVLGTALFTMTRPRLRSTGRLGTVCFGLLVMSAADALYWYLTTTGSFEDTTATDALWIVGFALLALGAGARTRRGSDNDSVHRHWWLTMSPSLVYAVGLITTFVVLAYPNGRRTTAWEVAGIIAMVLVGTAQRFAVMIENHNLTNGLEEVVARRTAQLAGSKRYFHSLVRASSDMVAVIDTDGEITWVSDAASSQYGLNPSDFIGSQVHERPSLWAVSEAIKAGLPEVQWELTDGQGRTRWASSTISDLRDDPDVQAFVINTRDVTDQVALEEQLRHQAFHDPLTGLPNRALFADRLNQAINRARNMNQLVGVAVIDLNGFKHLNDSHGHLAGDSVLKSVSERLSMLLGSDVTVARLGGDEFAVLFDQITTVDEAEELGNTISEHLRHEVSVNSTRFETSGSVGIAVALPGVDVSVEDLIRDADIAMYRAKGSGSVAAVVFAEEMHQQAQERFTLESDLRFAITGGQLRAFYQPVYDLARNKINGFEALLRWQHPSRGLVGPFDFIPVAEATGLIVPIGEWVMKTSIRQLAEWSRSFQDHGQLTMAINVSVGQLRSDRIVEVLRDEIASAGIDPGRITIEITESMVVTEDTGVVSRLRKISDLGVQLAIDDFGTGYASIANLRRLPIDVLKIDRQFVAEASTPGENLLGPIVQIGDAFGLTTVAEGIETIDQLDRLRDLGYHLGQGFLFSRPVGADQARQLLEEQFCAARPQSPVDRRSVQRSTISPSSPRDSGR